MDNVLNSPSLHNSTSTGDYKLCSYSLLGSNFNFIHLKFIIGNMIFIILHPLQFYPFKIFNWECDIYYIATNIVRYFPILSNQFENLNNKAWRIFNMFMQTELVKYTRQTYLTKPP